MQTLARLAFFKDVDGLDYDKLDRRVVWKRCDDGETIVDFEDKSTDVYFIVSGEVRVLFRTVAGKEVILADLKAGEFFGELAAIDGIPRSANVTALTKADLCIMPSAVFREILFASPSACDKVLRLLTHRVRDGNTRLAEMSIFDLRHRLYSELLRMSHPRPGAGVERVISPPPFHHVVAARIGCRREQVTRELSVMAAEGLIEKTRGALVVSKPQVLESRLAEALREGD
jgi:CRP/FNR family transcriptional regulator, cyclic AMP receptor protein